jgi:hypothetical protein
MSVKTSVTQDFTLSPVNNIDLSNEFNIGYSFITEVSHRYVEVTLTGTGSYAEMSKIFVGKRINIPQNSISTQSFRYSRSDQSDTRTNDYGQRFIDVRNDIRAIAGSIEFCTKDEFETLDDMFIFHNTTRPAWLILDPDNVAMNDSQYRLAIYGYFDRIPNWSASGGQLYTARVQMSEVV